MVSPPRARVHDGRPPVRCGEHRTPLRREAAPRQRGSPRTCLHRVSAHPTEQAAPDALGDRSAPGRRDRRRRAGCRARCTRRGTRRRAGTRGKVGAAYHGAGSRSVFGFPFGSGGGQAAGCRSQSPLGHWDHWDGRIIYGYVSTYGHRRGRLVTAAWQAGYSGVAGWLHVKRRSDCAYGPPIGPRAPRRAPRSAADAAPPVRVCRHASASGTRP